MSQYFIVHVEIVFHVGHVPPSQVQSGCVIFNHALKNRASPTAKPLHAARDDCAAAELRFLQGEFLN